MRNAGAAALADRIRQPSKDPLRMEGDAIIRHVKDFLILCDEEVDRSKRELAQPGRRRVSLTDEESDDVG